MVRFLCKQENLTNKKFVLTDPEVIKRARIVLRLKVGDEIELFDGLGNIYKCKIGIISKDKFAGKVLSAEEREEDLPHIILAQAIPKASKLDDIVRMNTEIGVREFVIFGSDHAQIKAEDLSEKKVARLLKVVREAARQSLRVFVPVLQGPVEFSELLQADIEQKLMLHPDTKENSSTKQIKEIASNLDFTKKIMLIIGPEGGFSPAEISLAREKGVQLAVMPTPVLRTQTAGLAAAAMILAHYDRE